MLSLNKEFLGKKADFLIIRRKWSWVHLFLTMAPFGSVNYRTKVTQTTSSENCAYSTNKYSGNLF